MSCPCCQKEVLITAFEDNPELGVRVGSCKHCREPLWFFTTPDAEPWAQKLDDAAREMLRRRRKGEIDGGA